MISDRYDYYIPKIIRLLKESGLYLKFLEDFDKYHVDILSLCKFNGVDIGFTERDVVWFGIEEYIKHVVYIRLKINEIHFVPNFERDINLIFKNLFRHILTWFFLPTESYHLYRGLMEEFVNL